MPAKDYRLVVSGMMGNVYISKVSKTNPHLMLSDRREVPVSELYQCIEHFAKAKIAEGFSTLEVTEANGKPVFEIRLPNAKLEARKKEILSISQTLLPLAEAKQLYKDDSTHASLIDLLKKVIKLTS